MFSFRQFDIIWLLTQGGPSRSTEILAIHLYKTGFRYRSFGEASAIAWLKTDATFALSAYALKVMYSRFWRSV